MQAIWVSGAPSFVGGADTELFHQIILWRKHGINVQIVPTCEPNRKMKSLVSRLGCRFNRYRPGIFSGKTVVSYCNGDALKRLLDDAGNRPQAFIWFNCMTWTTSAELDALRGGMITHLGFVSNYQRKYLLKEYAKELPEMCFGGRVVPGRKGFPEIIDYTPWLDISQFKVMSGAHDYFGVGRISRADPAKFSKDCWAIFDRVSTPAEKKVFVLGYDKRVEEVTGPPPPGMNWQWWSAGAISSAEFFSKIDVMIHKTGGSRESYCRVFAESMAHGVVPLAEREFAFPEMLRHSPQLRDYLLCGNSDEMSFKASQLAFYPAMLRHMKTACRRYAQHYFSREEPLIRNWRRLLQ